MKPNIYRILFLFALTIMALSAFAVDIPIVIQGKSGKALAEAIRNYCKPTTYLDSDFGANGIWAAFRTTDSDAEGKVIDRYSTTRRDFPTDPTSPVSGMTIDRIVCTDWWVEDKSADNHPYFDLFNVFPADAPVADHKKNYPPGIVTAAEYDNGTWMAGKGEIYGIEVNIYEPSDAYKGDFARAIMYVAVMYPCKLWSNLGENFFDDNTFPTLNTYAKQLLLKWHAEDPVSDLERSRNNAVEAIQGNRNPFVDYPEIVDHIWGDKSDEDFVIENELHPLKASYRISEKSIDLVSPYVPDDASWTIDGKNVLTKSVKPTDLGIGIHELKFNSPTLSGKLKIEITE